MFPLATGNIFINLPQSNIFSIFRVNVIYQAGNQAPDFEENAVTSSSLQSAAAKMISKLYEC